MTDERHLCLVLPSTGEFDSRTHRIATSAIARGHRVTVVARWSPGLPLEESKPAGYRLIRVPASAIDGLPFPRVALAIRNLARRLHARRTHTPYRPLRPLAEQVREPEGIPATRIAADAMETEPATTSAARPTTPARAVPAVVRLRRRVVSLPRRVGTEVVRRFAMPLTIRSHVRNALAVVPAADLYHGMAYMGIPVALAVGRRHHAPVVYDARDIYLEARTLARAGRSYRAMAAAMERRWAARADRVVTVNRAYAEVMSERLRVPEPLIVMNCSVPFSPPVPRERRFHDALGLAPDLAVILYHGGLFPERGIEPLMDAIPGIPRAVLVLMGYGRLEAELRAKASGPPYAGLVHLLPAVQPADLHAWVACADIAAMPIQPSTLNHRLTTPNKLFEAMAAGVPVLASDLPGMATIVRETGCGRLVDPTRPDRIAAELNAMLEQPAERAAMAERALAAVRERYNWPSQADVLFTEYARLSGTRW